MMSYGDRRIPSNKKGTKGRPGRYNPPEQPPLGAPSPLLDQVLAWIANQARAQAAQASSEQFNMFGGANRSVGQQAAQPASTLFGSTAPAYGSWPSEARYSGVPNVTQLPVQPWNPIGSKYGPGALNLGNGIYVPSPYANAPQYYKGAPSPYSQPPGQGYLVPGTGQQPAAGEQQPQNPYTYWYGNDLVQKNPFGKDMKLWSNWQTTDYWNPGYLDQSSFGAGIDAVDWMKTNYKGFDKFGQPMGTNRFVDTRKYTAGGDPWSSSGRRSSFAVNQNNIRTNDNPWQTDDSGGNPGGGGHWTPPGGGTTGGGYSGPPSWYSDMINWRI
jgi:hypothetical protein